MKEKILGSLLVWSCLCCSLGFAADEQQIQKARDRIFDCTQALERDPSSDALKDALLSACSEAVHLDPLDAGLHIQLGEAYQQEGSFTDAESEYKAALRLSPGERNSKAEKLLSELPAAKGMALSTCTDPDEVKFQAEKNRRRQYAGKVYAAVVREALEKAWTPPSHTELLKTKCMITIAPDGRVLTDKITHTSASKAEDECISKLIDTFPFPKLAAGLPSLDLYATFMSDAEMNLVEVGTQPEPPAVPFANNAPAVVRWGQSFPAAARNDVGYGPYMADLQRRIKHCWFPPKGNESKRVVVTFEINRYGQVSELKLEHSSGLEVCDKAAERAITCAAPFSPLPAAAPDKVAIQFIFDFNVFAGGGHGVFISR